MNETIIQKIEARKEKDKEWRLSNQDGNFLNVIFSVTLENQMKQQRNFSFNRFESEQLNELSKLVPKLTANYQVQINQQTIGAGYLPLSSELALNYLQKIEA